MNALGDEHSAPIVQADFTRSILGKTFRGAEAVVDCMFVPRTRAVVKGQIRHLDVSQPFCFLAG